MAEPTPHHPASPMEMLRQGALSDLDAARSWILAMETMLQDRHLVDEGTDTFWTAANDALWSAYLKMLSYRDIHDCGGSG